MLTEAKVAELKAIHGSDLYCVETPHGDFVFKKPTRHSYDRWSDKNADGRRTEAARELVQSCLAVPDYGQLIAALEVEPALLQGEFLEACLALAGVKEKREVKKL
jgi:hypothetical protein